MKIEMRLYEGSYGYVEIQVLSKCTKNLNETKSTSFRKYYLIGNLFIYHADQNDIDILGGKWAFVRVDKGRWYIN